MAKPVKKRSEQGRNESKRPRVAGKGFVGKGLTKSEQKAVGKKVAPYAALAVPGGLGVKAAVKGAKAVKAAKAAKAAKKTSKPKVDLPPPPPGSKPTYGPKKSPYKSQDEINRAAAAERKAAQDRKSYLAREAKKTPKPPKPSKPGLRTNYGGWMS
jgi:hypothetical protein